MTCFDRGYMSKENAVPDIGGLLGPVKALAHVAGERIMEIYGQDFSVKEKEDKSPLTEAWPRGKWGLRMRKAVT